MFRNDYEMEMVLEEKLRSLRSEAGRERLIRLARQGQEKRSYLRRTLSGLGENLIRAGVGLTKRYGEYCAEHVAMLDHVLASERASSGGRALESRALDRG